MPLGQTRGLRVLEPDSPAGGQMLNTTLTDGLVRPEWASEEVWNEALVEARQRLAGPVHAMGGDQGVLRTESFARNTGNVQGLANAITASRMPGGQGKGSEIANAIVRLGIVGTGIGAAMAAGGAGGAGAATATPDLGAAISGGMGPQAVVAPAAAGSGGLVAPAAAAGGAAAAQDMAAVVNGGAGAAGAGGAAAGGGGLLGKAGTFVRNNRDIIGSVLEGVGNSMADERGYDAQRDLLRERAALTAANYNGTNPGRTYRGLAPGQSTVPAADRYDPNTYGGWQYEYDPRVGKIVRVPVQPQ